MSLRDGLANLRASRSGEPQEEQATPTPPTQPAAPAPVAAPPEGAPEKRETFSTRIRPSVRYALKRQLLDLQEQGQKVRMEDVLEALIQRYVQDEEFRKNINGSLKD